MRFSIAPSTTRAALVSPSRARQKPCTMPRAQAADAVPREHLPVVPRHVRSRRQRCPGSWSQFHAMQAVHAPPGIGAGRVRLRHPHPALLGQAQRTAVEQLVVQGTQRQAVVEVVRQTVVGYQRTTDP